MSWILIAIAFAIMNVSLAIYDHLEYKRRKKEERKRLKRIIEIMRDPKWKESMRQCMRKNHGNNL